MTRHVQPLRVSRKRPQTSALNAAQKGKPMYLTTQHMKRRAALKKKKGRPGTLRPAKASPPAGNPTGGRPSVNLYSPAPGSPGNRRSNKGGSGLRITNVTGDLSYRPGGVPSGAGTRAEPYTFGGSSASGGRSADDGSDLPMYGPAGDSYRPARRGRRAVDPLMEFLRVRGRL